MMLEQFIQRLTKWKPVLIALALLWSGNTVTQACSGIYPETVQEAYHRADSVFLGKVLTISEKREDPKYSFGYYEATLSAKKWWKGEPRSQVTVRFDTSTCGAFLQKGQEGIFFASGKPLFTSALSGNVLDGSPGKITPIDADYQKLLSQTKKELETLPKKKK